METLTLLVVLATLALTSGFAFDDEHNAVEKWFLLATMQQFLRGIQTLPGLQWGQVVRHPFTEHYREATAVQNLLNRDLVKERFARDLAKQKFAFAFAKRGQDALEEKLRFARDLENAKHFAFAKRDSELGDEDRVQQRFARDLDNNKKFAFAFAKRFADRDGQLVRFARPSFA